MRKSILVAGLAVAALLPSMAAAHSDCQDQRHNNKVVGTVVGAGLGALLGSAVAGGDDRTGGAIIGGVGGAVAGNVIGGASKDCTAYGYYDSNGVWHSQATAASNANGYYDRDGRWVAGVPNGYYDSSGRWVAGSGDATASGYYDGQGRWVPVAANGYYASNGQWVAGSASGHYDTYGRWIPGAATGRYDANGRWIPGAASGHYDSAHRWVADAQTGYYDSDGHWRAGRAVGYYDANGRWVSTANSAGAYGADVAYERQDMWAGAPLDINARENWLDRRIRTAVADRTLSRYQGRDALRQLDRVRRQESRDRRYGGLNSDQRVELQASLDRIVASLHWDGTRGSDRYPASYTNHTY